MKAMNIKNISGGFKASGIYPFNKKAITIPKPPMESLPEQSGLKYIPLYSPANRGTRHLSEQCISFSQHELELFEKRYEEEYDLADDPRYNLWRKMYHPSTDNTIRDPKKVCFFPSSTKVTTALP